MIFKVLKIIKEDMFNFELKLNRQQTYMKVKCFATIVTPTCNILILGTAPGEESITKQEYYASPSNHFWDFIYRIFDEEWEFFTSIQKP